MPVMASCAYPNKLTNHSYEENNSCSDAVYRSTCHGSN